MSLPLATFIAVAGFIVGMYWLFVAEPEMREQRALRRRLKAQTVAEARLGSLTRAPETLSKIDVLNVLLGRVGNVSGRVRRLIDEAGLNLTVGAFMLMTVALFLLGGVLAQHFLRVPWFSPAAALAAAALPTMVVRLLRTRRMRKFEEQFPEAIELIARALRAGHAFATGLKIAADEMPDPVGPELRLLFDRQNFGAQLGDAMKTFAERVRLLDARFFVTAVMTQRETGGNLSEVLDRLAAVMRERFKTKREVRVKSAHGRLTAMILAGMPPSLALLLYLINPDSMHTLTTDPLGQRMLMTGAVMQVVGTLMVRRLVNIRY